MNSLLFWATLYVIPAAAAVALPVGYSSIAAAAVSFIYITAAVTPRCVDVTYELVAE